MKNIVFSTTRQYNPGDEFILMGLENLFADLGIEYNAIIANRHPVIDRNWKGLSLDNSFDFVNWDLIDYVVFAGSPAWWQNRGSIADVMSAVGQPSFKNAMARYLQLDGLHITNALYEGINRYDKRCAYLGVGIGTRAARFNRQVLHTFADHTDVIVTRNQRTRSFIPAQYDPILLPCPALFSADPSHERIVSHLDRVLFVLQGVQIKRKYDGVEKSEFDYLIEEFHEVRKSGKDTAIACFAWQDYIRVKELLPEENIIYEFRSEKWSSFISRFDFVVSSRVHGCGIASSLQIPNIMLQKNMRSDTAELFLSRFANKGDSIVEMIKDTPVEDTSLQISKHKAASKEKWLVVLKEKLSILQ